MTVLRATFPSRASAPLDDETPPAGYALLAGLLHCADLDIDAFVSACRRADPAALTWRLLPHLRTLVGQAVIRGQHDALFLLLAAGADAEALDARGWAPIHHAAAQDDPIAMGLLLAARCDPDTATAFDTPGGDGTGWSPLHLIARRGRLDSRCASLLIAQGASLNAEAPDGATPRGLQRRAEVSAGANGPDEGAASC